MTETPPVKTSQDLQVSHIETEPSTSLCESDYEAIAAAVMETDRGRWFLQEYARRNRNSDTQTVLTAIEKLEARISEDASTPKEATSVALLGHDLIDLAGAISQVKKEVADLGGQGNDPDHFNTATVELEAIVEQTESATSEILEAAEKIQEVTWILREEGASETQCDIIESKIVDVYTACSFQDLTGQRSNKVVQLVGYVERRVASMMSILGLSDEAVAAAPDTQRNSKTANESAPGLTPEQRHDTRPDAELLNGPAMSGEGNEQGDVDALFGDGAFDAVAETDTDTAASVDPDVMTAAADDNDGDEIEFDKPDFSQDSTPPTTEEISDHSEVLDPSADQELDESAESFDAVEMPEAEAAQDDAPEVTSELVEREQNESQADFGEDDEGASTPEAADIFGFDVFGDPQLVELQDAEILSQSNEQELPTTPDDQAKQDIFEVDPLTFGGDAFGAGTDSELDGALEDETDGAPKAVVGLPGDFDVDSNVADMFVAAGAPDSTGEDGTNTSAKKDQELADGQDIFEADCVDVSATSTAIDEMELEQAVESDAVDIMADSALENADDHGADDHGHDEDAVDVDTEETPSVIAADGPTSDDLLGNQQAQDEAELDQTAIDAPSEVAMDDQLIALDVTAAPDDHELATPLQDNQVNAAEKLMEQILAETSAATEETQYPDDEYTAEERIALFS